MRGAPSGRRAATALLFATAAFAVVAFNSGVVVDAGCPFLEMQGNLLKPLSRRAKSLRRPNPIEGAWWR